MSNIPKTLFAALAAIPETSAALALNLPVLVIALGATAAARSALVFEVIPSPPPVASSHAALSLLRSQ
ncbi:hypothetical protein bhYOR_001441 (plasmid) [Borrelia nietonii YOR]|uniref:Uncharacterized protein n=1 Tax=Borrelia hermsii MTW TaxID=1313291 RepID=W5T665_BORHE|nr:hypothetical protein [Borrelia hermsii]AHH14800.1 hypothetical protein BHW_0900070 [Borrelia hermsii MTW]UPA10107.1 hypothetical protein bhYOR_001441 [Borrelia nietonii YOR]